MCASGRRAEQAHQRNLIFRQTLRLNKKRGAGVIHASRLRSAYQLHMRSMARLPVFIILFESRTARLDTSGYIAHTAAAATAMPAAKPAAKATVFMPLISFRTFYLAFVIWTEIFKGKFGEGDGGARLRFFMANLKRRHRMRGNWQTEGLTEGLKQAKCCKMLYNPSVNSLTLIDTTLVGIWSSCFAAACNTPYSARFSPRCIAHWARSARIPFQGRLNV